MARLAVIGVIDGACGRSGVRAAEADVFNQGDNGDFRLVGGRERDEPGMVFLLAHVFAEADDLRRARFARDFKSGHLDAVTRAAVIDHSPHSFYDQMVLVFGNRNDLRVGTIKRACRAIIRTVWCADCSRLFEQVRHVHASADGDCRHRTQLGERRYSHRVLAD